MFVPTTTIVRVGVCCRCQIAVDESFTIQTPGCGAYVSHASAVSTAAHSAPFFAAEGQSSANRAIIGAFFRGVTSFRMKLKYTALTPENP